MLVAGHRGVRVGAPENTMEAFLMAIEAGVDMIETDRYGTYHATNEGGYISWADFAAAIFRTARMDNVTVVPVTTEEYGLSKAARPFNSRLDKSKLVANGFTPLPSWQDALERYIKELNK